MFFIYFIAPYKVIQDSLGFWISSGFQSLVRFRVPKPRIPHSTSKISLDTGVRVTSYGPNLRRDHKSSLRFRSSLSFPRETSDTQTIIRHPQTIDDKIDLIHDFRHLMCTRAIDGKKEMLPGILRGKQVISTCQYE